MRTNCAPVFAPIAGASRSRMRAMTDRPTYVRDLMTKDVVTLERNEKLVVADDVMRLGRIRHLPIVDEEGALAGIVSQRDLFHSGLIKALGYGTHAQKKALDMLVVKEAMKTEVTTTTPDTKLGDPFRRNDFVHLKLVNAGSAERLGLYQVESPPGRRPAKRVRQTVPKQ